MRLGTIQPDPEEQIRRHIRLLNHNGYGITELRTFESRPMVAYADSEESVVSLTCQIHRKVSGIYIGVQPRIVDLFDYAPNCWQLAQGEPKSNCACDKDIEYLTTVFFYIDVVSPDRNKGHPASDAELQNTLEVAGLFCGQDTMNSSSTICSSGNGHYVLASLVPVSIDSDEIAAQFKQFCQNMAQKVVSQVPGVKIDPVYNLSRVMRLMGTINRKGKALPDRPHRRAFFETDLFFTKSYALAQMILNTEVEYSPQKEAALSDIIKCNLEKVEDCEFIQWCRIHPLNVTEPQWFALITNLAHLDGGPKLIHAISALDMFRYDYQRTQSVILRVLRRGYNPTTCEKLRTAGFFCHKLNSCPVRAPMYLATLHAKYNR